jgi:hypothetical protein
MLQGWKSGALQNSYRRFVGWRRASNFKTADKASRRSRSKLKTATEGREKKRRLPEHTRTSLELGTMDLSGISFTAAAVAAIQGLGDPRERWSVVDPGWPGSRICVQRSSGIVEYGCNVAPESGTGGASPD